MFTFFESLKLSVFETKFGNRIESEDLGKSMKYLILLMLIIGSVIMVKIVVNLNSGLGEFVTSLNTDFPDFELKDGHFICQGAMPFIKTEKGALLIIDTSGKTSADILDGYKSGALITESTIVYKKSTVETRSYNLIDFKKFNITKSRLIEIINQYTIPGMILFFLLGLFFIYVWKMFGVLTLSVIALVVSKIIKVGIDYQNLFKISIYAITIPTIINSTLGLFEVNIPYFWVVYYAIATFYVWRFIKSFDDTSVEQDMTLINN